MLAEFEPERVTISYRQKPLMRLRGLTTDDVAYIVRVYRADLARLFDMHRENVGEAFAILLSEHTQLTVLQETPALVADIICRAADEPDAHDRARMLPLPIQLNALEVITKLTFEDAGGPKAFLVSVMSLVQKSLQMNQATDTSG